MVQCSQQIACLIAVNLNARKNQQALIQDQSAKPGAVRHFRRCGRYRFFTHFRTAERSGTQRRGLLAAGIGDALALGVDGDIGQGTSGALVILGILLARRGSEG